MVIPGFTLLVDDKDIELFGMKLVNYETQSYIGRKVTGVDIPGAHGTQAVPSSLTSNSFFANVVCAGKDADEVQNRLRQFFAFMYSTQDSHKIVFTNDMSVVRYAILESPDNHKVTEGVDGAMAEVKLTFLMLDPFTYQNESDSLVTVAKHGQKITLENEALECGAIFRLKNTGMITVTGAGIIVNDELASFSYNLAPGDEIVLDTIEYEVKLNGNVRLDFWTGEMPLLKNGDNIIFQQNTEQADLLLSIEFTKQWV